MKNTTVLERKILIQHKEPIPLNGGGWGSKGLGERTALDSRDSKERALGAGGVHSPWLTRGQDHSARWRGRIPHFEELWVSSSFTKRKALVRSWETREHESQKREGTRPQLQGQLTEGMSPTPSPLLGFVLCVLWLSWKLRHQETRGPMMSLRTGAHNPSHHPCLIISSAVCRQTPLTLLHFPGHQDSPARYILLFLECALLKA